MTDSESRLLSEGGTRTVSVASLTLAASLPAVVKAFSSLLISGIPREAPGLFTKPRLMHPGRPLLRDAGPRAPTVPGRGTRSLIIPGRVDTGAPPALSVGRGGKAVRGSGVA